MSTADHPITLQKVFFTRSVVIAVHGHEPKSGQAVPLPVNQIEVSKVDGQDHLRLATMRTLLNPEQDTAYAYNIDMECCALLGVDEALSEADAERGVLITAHSVCYGAIREAVAWITGRQPYGELTLGLSILKFEPRPSAVSKP